MFFRPKDIGEIDFKRKEKMILFFWWVSYIFFGPLLRFFGRIKVRGSQNVFWLPPGLPYIVIANHTSYLDPFVLGLVLFETNRKICPIYFMAKKEFFCFPLGLLLKAFGAFFVDTVKPLSATKKAINILFEGKTLGIFPEGTRSPNGCLLPFKNGVDFLAQKTQAYVIPVVILGTFSPGKGFWSGLKKIGKFLLRKYRIEVFLGPIFLYNKNSSIEERYRAFYSYFLNKPQRE